MPADSTKTTAGAERPRTWTLKLPPFYCVRVIELEPVLKLVQDLRDMPPKGSRRNRIRDEAAALLTAHRRLP